MSETTAAATSLATKTPLPTRRFGRMPFDVTAMGFGGAPLGNFMTPISQRDADAMLEAAWEAGIRMFETAPLYGSGLSERRLGLFLGQFPREDYVISTKVGYLLRPGRPESGPWTNGGPFHPSYDYSYHGVTLSFEESLQRMGLDHVDIVLIHDVDVINHGKAAQARFFETAMDEGWQALSDLRAEGQIKAIGIGVNEWQVCHEALLARDFDCILPAGDYSLLRHDCLDALLPLCEERNVAVIAGGGYHGGILATGAVPGAKFDYAPASPAIMERVRQIEAVCARYAVSLPAAATQFILAHPAISTLIHGVRNQTQLQTNIEWLQAPIPPEFWQALKAEAILPADAPVPS